MRGRKPAWELSARAIAECSYDRQLHVTAATRKRGKDHYQLGRYTWISHYASGVLDIGLQYWWRYRHTGDLEWMRAKPTRFCAAAWSSTGASPARKAWMASTTSTRPMPANGSGVCVTVSPTWRCSAAPASGHPGGRDAELDADLRAKWKEFLDHLAPYPMGSEPEAQALTGGVLSDDTWAAGRLGDVNGSRNGEIVWESPVFPYEHVTLATKDVDPAYGRWRGGPVRRCRPLPGDRGRGRC